VIVAQKAATVAVMSDGRFRLGVGAGENLNEHVVGRGWPPVHIRHEMLEEAIEIIRALWGGGYYAHQGKHYRVDDARIFTLPDEPPPIYVAVSGRDSVALAERAGDGMVAIHPRAELTHPFAKAGKPRYGQLALAVDEDEARARRLADELFRFSAGGWKVQSELPNPINFEAATARVRECDVAKDIPAASIPIYTRRRSDAGSMPASTGSRSSRSAISIASSSSGSRSCAGASTRLQHHRRHDLRRSPRDGAMRLAPMPRMMSCRESSLAETVLKA
jgi:alkanesulfonate monooxygenase SsuD/methylene tetrahydromethanopterin reductase-like flavin-dependent oxidoreductase (luciferase family)